VLALAWLWLGGMSALAAPPGPPRADAPLPDRWRQFADPVFQPLGTAEGLQSISTQAVAQDGQGFIWIGTDDGIARWDGYRMRIYRPDGRDPRSLPHTVCMTLHTDSSGHLWIGTGAGGMARYNPDSDDFTRAAVEGEPTTRMETRAIIDDGQGGLWVGGTAGLYHMDPPPPGGVPVLRHDPDFHRSEGQDEVLGLLRDRDGGLWLGTYRGLYRRAAHGKGFVQVKLVGADGLAHGVRSLLQDSAGQIWAGTLGAGAFRIDPASLAARQIPNAPQAGALRSLDVEAIIEAQPGEIWLGTLSEGIFAVRSDELSTRQFHHDPTHTASLAGDAVLALYRDRTGAVWLATDHGVDRYMPGQRAFVTMFGETGRGNGISDPDVFALYGAPDGRVWAGLLHDGIDIVSPETGQVSRLIAGRDLPNTVVIGLAGVPGMGVFIATYQGLYVAPEDGGAPRAIALPGAPARQPVTAITRAGNTIWLGNIDGVFRLDLDTPAQRQALSPRRVLAAEALTDRRLRVLLPDPSGKLWIGTFDGLNLADLATGQVEKLRTDPADPRGLHAGPIGAMVLDRRGRLWLSMVGNGIDILPAGALRSPGEVRPVLRHLGVEDGLPHMTVDMLLAGPDGDIWGGTDDGVVRIDPDTLRMRSFHATDGVPIPAYWAGAGAVTPQGELLFGGTGGLLVVRPLLLDKAAGGAPPVVVTDVRIGRRPVSAGWLNGTGSLAPLVIQPDTSSLTVEFSTLDYADPARARYAYRLQGVDRDWIETDPTRRAASYTNLPPGNFTLLLRGADSTHPDLRTIRRIPIKVLPAWYQTPWFGLACIGLGIGAIAGLLRLQGALLRRRQRGLERLVAQRTAELSQSNAALTRTASILRELDGIGQEITASLDVETIFPALFGHLERLLNTCFFAVYLPSRPGEMLLLRFGIQDGVKLPTGTPVPREDEAAMAEAMRQRREVFRPTMGDARDTQACYRVVCAPLIVQDRVIGAMLLHSRLADPLSERESLIVRSIAAYGAIALDNAETVKTLADMRSRLQEMAYSDGLTKLPNRRMYLDQFERFRAQAVSQGTRFTLMLVDLDKFKLINDTYGHDTGDATLVEAARRLQSVVRGRDCVMRLGGDEFAILLADTGSLESIAFICQRISENFEWPLRFNELAVQASTSIGAAIFPEDGMTHEQLYKAADLALYAAKRAGRRTWRKYEPELAAAEMAPDMQAAPPPAHVTQEPQAAR
jgi:diguanylate cyclase (GGDEF)-like protein